MGGGRLVGGRASDGLVVIVIIIIIRKAAYKVAIRPLHFLEIISYGHSRAPPLDLRLR